MYDVQGRRAALSKVFAGAAAARLALGGIAAGAETAGVETEKGGKHRQKRVRPEQILKGKLRNIVYTPAADGDPIHYIITADGEGDGTMHHVASDRDVKMSNKRLAHFIDRKSGGRLNGAQSARIQGINWRIHGVEYDAKANTWRIDAKVCDSNPNARPKISHADDLIRYGGYNSYVGCNCTCGDKCYHCSNWEGCGKSYSDVCH
ncbi:MAG: hypothetical protein ACR2J8_11190 [Thermomicrobiales bacterium]